jgi:Flp pilus assembly protein CpaB
MSVVAALIAGTLILVYVNRYRSSVKSEATPVTVLIARQDIPKGTSGAIIAQKGLYTATTIRQSQLLDGALSDPSVLQGKVTTHEIFANSQFTATDFAVSTGNLAASLTDHQRIVGIPFDAAHGLTAELQPGNRVDIYAGFNVVPINPNGTPQQGGQSRPVLRRIMENILVAGIAGRKAGALSSGSTILELKVRDDEAANLAFASDNGKLWVALRPSTGGKSAPPSIVDLQTLLLGQSPVSELRRYGGR